MIPDNSNAYSGEPLTHENQSPPVAASTNARLKEIGVRRSLTLPGFCCGFGTVRGTWLREVRNDGLTPARLLTYKQNLLEK